MNNKDVEKILTNLSEDFAPNNYEQTKDKCSHLLVKSETKSENSCNKNIKTWLYTYKRAVLACAMLVLLIFGGFGTYGYLDAPYAHFTIDINPSIIVTMNRLDQVVNITANNEDGQEILAELTFKKASLDKTLDLLLDKIIEKGYMENSPTVTITQLSEENEKKPILDKVELSLKTVLSEKKIESLVKKQTITEKQKEDAEKLGVSFANLKLIEEIIELDDSQKVITLKKLTNKELIAILQELRGGQSNKDNLPNKRDK